VASTLAMSSETAPMAMAARTRYVLLANEAFTIFLGLDY
jgi:hypothetical protein